MEAHGEDLREAGGSEAIVRALKRDPRSAALPRRQAVLRDFALKLTKNPNRMSRADLQHLRDVGLSDKDILDVVEVVAYFNYINRVADALGVDPEPEWPKQPAWKRRLARRRATVTPRARGRAARPPRRR